MSPGELGAAKVAAEYYSAVAAGKPVELSRPNGLNTWERPVNPLEAKAQQFADGWRFRVAEPAKFAPYQQSELHQLVGSTIQHVAKGSPPFVYAIIRPGDSDGLFQNYKFHGGKRDGEPVGKAVT